MSAGPETSAGGPVVRFRGASKRFGETVVLDELDLAVAPQEKIAIIGASGSGKSTLLRILMTLESVDAGTVEVEGLALWRDGKPGGAEVVRAVRARVGMVFQQFNLFPHMTVLDNVAFAPRRVRGASRADAEADALGLLEQVGLAEKAGAYPDFLSGGQKQRVAIARALAMRPKLMLFDEVTSALDPELVGEVLEVIRTLARESRMTLLLVTHEMRFAREIADRVVYLDEGRVVESGPPAQVLVEPTHERTRRFLRSILEA